MSQNQYTYSVRRLRDIAANYDHIYQGIEFNKGKPYRFPPIYHHFDHHYIDYYYIGGVPEDDDLRYLEVNPWKIAEYKADFDIALDAIGRGHWVGEIMEYKYYRNFSKYQRLIIADICGIPIEDTGIDYAFQLHGRAYGKLKRFLNKTDEFQFISKPLDKVIDN